VNAADRKRARQRIRDSVAKIGQTVTGDTDPAIVAHQMRYRLICVQDAVREIADLLESMDSD